MLRRLIDRWRSWRLGRAIAAGRIRRGRVNRLDAASVGVKAKAEPLATMKARVYRAATDTWEEVV